VSFEKHHDFIFEQVPAEVKTKFPPVDAHYGECSNPARMTSISISNLSVWGNINTQVATGRKYQHFDCTFRQVLGIQNYNPFGGNEMVVFG
jgi:hypothetical protein